MKILKFGGTSLADSERIENAVGIVRQAAEERPAARIPAIVVVSAMAGVTNDLLAAAAAAASRETTTAVLSGTLDVDATTAATAGRGRRRARRRTAAYRSHLKSLWARHTQTAEDLAGDERHSVVQTITRRLDKLESLLEASYLLGETSPRTSDRILAYGERLSAILFAAALRARGVAARFLDARRLILTDETFGHAQVDFDATRERIRAAVGTCRELPVVTGFTGATAGGETTTLGRGGSDYTAALLGAALDAEAIELWTDVDGVMSADPRIVADAFPLPRLSYAELMELSHFGAKVVFPPTIHPARSRGIPLVIRNTLNPRAAGTRVKETAPASESAIRGVSSIQQVSLMRLEGDGMVGVPGIAGRLFGALARKSVSVILISQASSEHSICFAVAPEDAGPAAAAVGEEFELERRLEMIDELIVEEDRSVIAAVGEQMRDKPGIAGRLFRVLGQQEINVRAVAQGSSELNVSLVVDHGDERAALKSIHDAFFHPRRRRILLALAGTGRVGSELLEQLRHYAGELADREGIDVRLVALADSRRLALDSGGIDLADWRSRLEAAPALEPERLRELLCAPAADRRIFVDCTASADVTGWYADLLACQVAVVAANKLAFSGPMSRYRELEQAQRRGGGPLLFEATVGAGLPVLRTLDSLRRTGHVIRRVDGILSGTVNAVLERLSAGDAFSQAVRGAHADGLTEPHPYDDLCGGDVVRKLTILARLTDRELEPEDVEVEPLLRGEHWREMALDAFWGALPELDQEYAGRRERAAHDGRRLRYVASLGESGARVKLEAVAADHPAYALAGPDNLIAFTTQHYRDTPLVIRGPGAGPAVTASGVFADVLLAADLLERVRL